MISRLHERRGRHRVARSRQRGRAPPRRAAWRGPVTPDGSPSGRTPAVDASSSTSVPIPLIVLGGMSAALLAAGGVGYCRAAAARRDALDASLRRGGTRGADAVYTRHPNQEVAHAKDTHPGRTRRARDLEHGARRRLGHREAELVAAGTSPPASRGSSTSPCCSTGLATQPLCCVKPTVTIRRVASTRTTSSATKEPRAWTFKAPSRRAESASTALASCSPAQARGATRCTTASPSTAAHGRTRSSR